MHRREKSITGNAYQTVTEYSLNERMMPWINSHINICASFGVMICFLLIFFITYTFDGNSFQKTTFLLSFYVSSFTFSFFNPIIF